MRSALTPYPQPKPPGTTSVADRPKPVANANRASGSVTSVKGPVTFIRGGKRVSVAAGGRIAKGDHILIGRNGRVEIRFDNPKAGPSGDGMLIAGRGRYIIDVDPVKKDPNVMITVVEGGARFIRPLVAIPLDVSISVEGGLFGQMTGTDVVAFLDDMDRDAVLAVRAGSAKVKALKLGRIMTGPRTGATWHVVKAGQEMRVTKAGKVTVFPMLPGAFEDYVGDHSLEKAAKR